MCAGLQEAELNKDWLVRYSMIMLEVKLADQRQQPEPALAKWPPTWMYGSILSAMTQILNKTMKD